MRPAAAPTAPGGHEPRPGQRLVVSKSASEVVKPRAPRHPGPRPLRRRAPRGQSGARADPTGTGSRHGALYATSGHPATVGRLHGRRPARLPTAAQARTHGGHLRRSTARRRLRLSPWRRVTEQDGAPRPVSPSGQTHTTASTFDHWPSHPAPARIAAPLASRRPGDASERARVHVRSEPFAPRRGRSLVRPQDVRSVLGPAAVAGFQRPSFPPRDGGRPGGGSYGGGRRYVSGGGGFGGGPGGGASRWTRRTGTTPSAQAPSAPPQHGGARADPDRGLSALERARSRSRGDRRAGLHAPAARSASQPLRGRRRPFPPAPRRDGDGDPAAHRRHDRFVRRRDRRPDPPRRPGRGARGGPVVEVLRRPRGRRRRGGLPAQAPRHHRHGPCRPRQDVAARPHPSVERGRRRGRWHHPAHRRLPGGLERPTAHLHRHARPRGLHGHAGKRGERHRHRRARRGGRRRGDAPDRRGDQPRQGGQRPDRDRHQQDRQGRRRSRTGCSSSSPSSASCPRHGVATRSPSRSPPSSPSASRSCWSSSSCSPRCSSCAPTPRETQGATVLESNLDIGRGPVATIIVQRGILRVGEPIVAGAAWGRVKALINDHGDQIKEAFPSMPVQVLGLSEPPIAGDELRVTSDLSIARTVGDAREQRLRFTTLAQASYASRPAPGRSSKTSSSRSGRARPRP